MIASDVRRGRFILVNPSAVLHRSPHKSAGGTTKFQSAGSSTVPLQITARTNELTFSHGNIVEDDLHGRTRRRDERQVDTVNGAANGPMIIRRDRVGKIGGGLSDQEPSAWSEHFHVHMRVLVGTVPEVFLTMPETRVFPHLRPRRALWRFRRLSPRSGGPAPRPCVDCRRAHPQNQTSRPSVAPPGTAWRRRVRRQANRQRWLMEGGIN